MTRYAITGADGFLGRHLRARLKALQPSTEVRAIGRVAFSDQDALAADLEGCDAVFHLAAVNSHDAAEARANVELAEVLAAALARAERPPRVVVHSNSLHATGDSPYGRSKAEAAAALRQWAQRGGAVVADVVLPNLFGEGGRPRYNSAVATFCEALVDGRAPEVNSDGRTELLHAQDAALALLQSAASGEGQHVSGEPIGIPDLYGRLAGFFEAYHGRHLVPALDTHLDLRLFNQLRGAMFPRCYPVALVEHADERGAFFEAARGFGATQTAFSTTVPGITRGDHWHLDKIERFLVLSGTATIEVRRLFDEKVHAFEVSGEAPAFIDMPTLHTHNITNVGTGDLLTMFWANDHFDAAAPDTFAEPVRVAERATT